LIRWTNFFNFIIHKIFVLRLSYLRMLSDQLFLKAELNKKIGLFPPPYSLSLIHTFVNISALIKKYSVFLTRRAGIKVWIGDIYRIKLRFHKNNNLLFRYLVQIWQRIDLFGFFAYNLLLKKITCVLFFNWQIHWRFKSAALFFRYLKPNLKPVWQGLPYFIFILNHYYHFFLWINTHGETNHSTENYSISWKFIVTITYKMESTPWVFC
jgi:hypothetical protein